MGIARVEATGIRGAAASTVSPPDGVDNPVISFFSAGQGKTLHFFTNGRVPKGTDPTQTAIGTAMLRLMTGLAYISARPTAIGER